MFPDRIEKHFGSTSYVSICFRVAPHVYSRQTMIADYPFTMAYTNGNGNEHTLFPPFSTVITMPTSYPGYF